MFINHKMDLEVAFFFDSQKGGFLNRIFPQFHRVTTSSISKRYPGAWKPIESFDDRSGSTAVKSVFLNNYIFQLLLQSYRGLHYLNSVVGVMRQGIRSGYSAVTLVEVFDKIVTRVTKAEKAESVQGGWRYWLDWMSS
jgi:hypothetical protein